MGEQGFETNIKLEIELEHTSNAVLIHILPIYFI